LRNSADIAFRQYFPPAKSADGSEKAEEGGGGAEAESELPVLPDVPSKEPTEPGQPEPKKQKVSQDTDQQGVESERNTEEKVGQDEKAEKL
jgi:hypothetical protein